MQRDIAPVRVPTGTAVRPLATLQRQSHRHTQDAAETTRGGALQVCFTRHLRRHAQPMRFMRLVHTRSADLAAYRVTSTRRLKLNKSFSRAGHVDVQRVVDLDVVRLISAARRLLSSPATRVHPGHLAQAI